MRRWFNKSRIYLYGNRAFKRKTNKVHYKWFAVQERHKSGKIHIHCIVDGYEKMKEYLNFRFCVTLANDLMGRCNFQQVYDDKDKAIESYVTKYIVKNIYRQDVNLGFDLWI